MIEADGVDTSDAQTMSPQHSTKDALPAMQADVKGRRGTEVQEFSRAARKPMLLKWRVVCG
jgi:hypothetical protein